MATLSDILTQVTAKQDAYLIEGHMPPQALLFYISLLKTLLQNGNPGGGGDASAANQVIANTLLTGIGNNVDGLETQGAAINTVLGDENAIAIASANPAKLMSRLRAIAMALESLNALDAAAVSGANSGSIPSRIRDLQNRIANIETVLTESILYFRALATTQNSFVTTVPNNAKVKSVFFQNNASTAVLLQVFLSTTAPVAGAVPFFPSFRLSPTEKILLGTDFFSNRGFAISPGFAIALSTTQGNLTLATGTNIDAIVGYSL